MLRMHEVVGTSKEGFSDAVRSAVDAVVRSGQKPHFFQVVEQRGSVRDGSIGEYQVILKIAVES
jgi:flavin-binding protein dodecin